MDGTSPSAHNAFLLPALPYPVHALEPYLSRETLEYHYGKHHRGYVARLNELVTGTAYQGVGLDELVRIACGTIFNNAAQVWNHSFYWSCLSPESDDLPSGALSNAIDAAFGSFKGFQQEFIQQALAKFGSGWTWLVLRPNGSLVVYNTDDAYNPLRRGETPLLTCDVWEHAYYIDYRNNRRKYLEAFFKIINWDHVGHTYDAGCTQQKPRGSNPPWPSSRRSQ